MFFLLLLKSRLEIVDFFSILLLYLLPMATAKNIYDSILNMLSKFSPTDESRVNQNWLYYKIDQVAAQLKINEYLITNKFPSVWLSDGGMINFHKVNKADDPSITFCDCEIGKAFIPQTINFQSKDGGHDGIYNLISACGKTQYFPRRMSMWSYTPSEHTNSMFSSYWRINTSLYTSKYSERMRLVAFFVNPEDGKLIESTPVASGSIVAGTVYLAKFNQITYDGFVYNANSTFTGVVGVTTFTGTGAVYLNSQVRAYRDTDPYPASPEMIRNIELEILTKEFNIEMKAIMDVRNDSKDDTTKSQ